MRRDEARSGMLVRHPAAGGCGVIEHVGNTFVKVRWAHGGVDVLLWGSPRPTDSADALEEVGEFQPRCIRAAGSVSAHSSAA